MKNRFALITVLIMIISLFYGCKGAYEGGLADAARTGDLQKAESYLNKGADVNVQWFGRAPLQVAADEGQVKVIELLLKKGANINAKSKFDKTALDYAEEKGKKEIIDFLKSKGAKRAKDLK